MQAVATRGVDLTAQDHQVVLACAQNPYVLRLVEKVTRATK